MCVLFRFCIFLLFIFFFFLLLMRNVWMPQKRCSWNVIKNSGCVMSRHWIIWTMSELHVQKQRTDEKKCVLFYICKVTLDICLILVLKKFLIRNRITILGSRSVFISIWTNRRICWRFELNSSEASKTFTTLSCVNSWISNYKLKTDFDFDFIGILENDENRKNARKFINMTQAVTGHQFGSQK